MKNLLFWCVFVVIIKIDSRFIHSFPLDVVSARTSRKEFQASLPFHCADNTHLTEQDEQNKDDNEKDGSRRRRRNDDDDDCFISCCRY